MDVKLFTAVKVSVVINFVYIVTHFKGFNNSQKRSDMPIICDCLFVCSTIQNAYRCQRTKVDIEEGRVNPEQVKEIQLFSRQTRSFS